LLTPVDIPLSVRSASCALERMAVVVLVASWVSERSASEEFVLIASLNCCSRVLMTPVAEVARFPIERSASPVLDLIAVLSC
jgi:hypothetical protein